MPQINLALGEGLWKVSVTPIVLNRKIHSLACMLQVAEKQSGATFALRGLLIDSHL